MSQKIGHIIKRTLETIGIVFLVLFILLCLIAGGGDAKYAHEGDSGFEYVPEEAEKAYEEYMNGDYLEGYDEYEERYEDQR